MKKRFCDRQIKNRYLIYIVLCSFFIGSFLGNISHAVSGTYVVDTIVNWDLVATGTHTGNVNDIHLQRISGTNNYVTNSHYRSSPNQYFMGHHSAQQSSWINLTEDYSHIEKFSLALRFELTYLTTTRVYMNFYNNGSVVLYLRVDVGKYLQYFASGGGWVTIKDFGTIHGLIGYFTLNVTHIVSNQMNYNLTGAYNVSVDGVSSAAVDWSTFDSIYLETFGLYCSGTCQGSSIYLDDIVITSGSVAVSPVDDYCGTDVTGFQHNSIGYLSSTMFSNKKYLEALYGLKMSTTIFGVSILVTGVQHTYSSNLSYYSLKINGDEQGPADCFKLVGSTVNDDVYALYWDSFISLTDMEPLFEFSHSSDIGGTGYYWDLYNAVNAVNWNPTIGHNSVSLYDGKYVYGVSSFYPVITFYYDTVLFENETSPYSDLVTCPKTTYNTFDTIPLSFFVSDFTYSNSIQLWRNGTQKTDAVQGFPYSVLTGDFFGELSYTPLLSGKYQFRLVRNGVIKSTFNVTVTDPADMNFVLAVYPNPCEFNTEVFIHFRFYPLDGAEGFIGVSEFPDTSGFSSFDESWLLSANTTGNKSFYPQTNMYVSLWKKSGNSSYVRVAIKYLKMYSLFDNTINVGYKSIQLSDAVPGVSQRIYGTQVVQGFNTFVRMNNKVLQYVTDTPFYNVYVDISKGGNYNAELCVETANGSKVLCSVNFTVSSPAAGGGAGAEAFPAEMKLLFGICCILVAVSCPLMISVKYHVAVPTFVYVVFMAFGIGIGTVLGFLELWLVFLFVVALVAGAVFTIFGHGGQGGGGGGGDSGTIRKGGILSRRRGKDYATASRKADYGVSPKGSPGYLKGPGRRGY